MKGLLCIMVDVHSSPEDLSHVMKIVERSVEGARKTVERELNSGATYHAQIGIRKSDPKNPDWLRGTMGDVFRWSLGKMEAEPVKKKSWWKHIIEDDW